MTTDGSRQSGSLCDAFIEVGSDPWAGTYCKLRAGHDGDHSPLYADESNALPFEQGAMYAVAYVKGLEAERSRYREVIDTLRAYIEAPEGDGPIRYTEALDLCREALR